ncbi:hypothetical protein RB2654_09529 [Rhodobacterales bacterium HTCC2654]|uniref:Uncharacterized protein n=1 Tax=Maritimibacter alkaliphilus HTCC2654 TaxID=314271 RepID=A3VEG2_9RHOB|nr:hypothetical protein RB2654_09529 [Rhodobacterales bacterium HTCC2654] [Maritimibacter alkaliphilus HTCC2654]
MPLPAFQRSVFAKSVHASGSDIVECDEIWVHSQIEQDWLHFLRDVGNGKNVTITLRQVQLLMRVGATKTA